MKKFLIKLWNKFVEGFETGVFQLITFFVGLSDEAEIMSLHDYLPEKYGRVFMGMAAVGIVCRYFIKIGWIKPVNVETPDVSA